MNEESLTESLNLIVPSPMEEISGFFQSRLNFHIKRDDLIHPVISGNKWRKLRLHLHEARFRKCKTLVTVGGAFSNHLIATAAAANAVGLKAVGIVRGEEVNLENPTLKAAQEFGMELHPVPRSEYKERNTEHFVKSWCQKFEVPYWVPEGGGGFLGIQGTMDIARELDSQTEVIVLSAGTGTTAAGIALAKEANQKVWVIPALKGDFMRDEIKNHINAVLNDGQATEQVMKDIEVYDGYARKGYGKIDDELLQFVDRFYQQTSIPLDYLYTAKAMMALEQILDEMQNIPQSITFIHTGGLQGNIGFIR